VIAILLGMCAPVQAALHTYRVGIDVGNNPATGCDFNLGAVAPGILPGFELQLTVVVDDNIVPPQVVSAQVETCDGAVFANPQPLPGVMLQLDSGVLSSDSVVASIPTSLLHHATAVRLAFHALSGGGSQDALFTQNGTPEGLPIILVLGGPIPSPTLSAVGTTMLVLLLLGITWWQWRRGRWETVAALASLVVLGAAVVVYAAFGEPVAVDDQADASPPDTRAEIFAAFAMPADSELALRLDVEDIPFETDCADATDNDMDGLTDCEDPNCNLLPCNALDACTVAAVCVDAACVGSPADCNDGNECTLDSCTALDATNYVCVNVLDPNKTEFGDCVGNCAVARLPDGRCTDPADECTLGRCTEDLGVVYCEQQAKVQISVEVGGCKDADACTADGCIDGTCVYLALEAAICESGGGCAGPCP
jgi:hypothetical protein